MHKPLWIIVAVIACLAGFFLIMNAVSDDQPTITLNKAIFNTVIVDTPVLRERGLSGSKPLAVDESMLFVFDAPDNIGIWMKDMNYSIDIVWLDSEYRIVHVEKNVSPETYPKAFYPSMPSLYVIEFLAGTIDRVGVKVGDAVSVSGGK